jgi:replicative DNA helicase
VTEILKRISLQDSTEVAQNIGWENKRVFEDKHNRALVKERHKVILIANSHAKGCAEKLASHLRNSYEVTEYIKPSTGMEVITNSAREEINHLTKDDVVIVCGGVNNIAKNESSKGLKYMTHFV